MGTGVSVGLSVAGGRGLGPSDVLAVSPLEGVQPASARAHKAKATSPCRIAAGIIRSPGGGAMCLMSRGFGGEDQYHGTALRLSVEETPEFLLDLVLEIAGIDPAGQFAHLGPGLLKELLGIAHEDEALRDNLRIAANGSVLPVQGQVDDDAPIPRHGFPLPHHPP